MADANKDAASTEAQSETIIEKASHVAESGLKIAAGVFSGLKAAIIGPTGEEAKAAASTEAASTEEHHDEEGESGSEDEGEEHADAPADGSAPAADGTTGAKKKHKKPHHSKKRKHPVAEASDANRHNQADLVKQALQAAQHSAQAHPLTTKNAAEFIEMPSSKHISDTKAIPSVYTPAEKDAHEAHRNNAKHNNVPIFQPGNTHQ